MEQKNHKDIQKVNVEYLHKINVKFFIQDMYRIFRKLGKKTPLFLIACAVLGMVFSLVTYRVDYVADADIRVSIKIPDSISSSSQNSYFLDTSKALSSTSVVLPLIQSDLFKGILSEKLNEDVVTASIEMSSVGSSNIFNIKVTSDDASYAMKVLNQCIDTFGEVGTYIIDTFEITDITSPEVSPSKWSPMDLILKTFVMILVGILILVCYIAYQALFRKTIHNQYEIENVIYQKYIGRIPYMRTLSKTIRNGKVLSLSKLMQQSIYTNTFQRIASNVQELLNREEHKVILVTATNHKEGVSNSAVGLGVGLALNGKNCIVIDGHFEDPILNKIVVPENFVDRNDYLTKKASVEKIIVPSEVPNLSFVLSNEEDNNKLLYFQNMKTLIQNLKEQYDYVLIDSDSMLLHADAESYVQESDLVCFLIRPGISKVSSIMDSINSLQECSCYNQEIACLINCIDKYSVY